jgi:hypothetical protein
MPKKAPTKEKKYKILIYHGHLHKIPLNDAEEDRLHQIKVLSEEESIKQDTS